MKTNNVTKKQREIMENMASRTSIIYKDDARALNDIKNFATCHGLKVLKTQTHLACVLAAYNDGSVHVFFPTGGYWYKA